MYIILVKATQETTKPVSKKLREAMDQYNDKLEEAGVRIMAKGLHPTAEAIRLSFNTESGAPTLSNGPFMGPDIVIGFFLLNVDTKEEATRWLLEAPDPLGHGEGQLELREVY